MSESQLPAWYRPKIVLPVLGVLYIAIPSKWDFSPQVLTQSMPYFLVGASDYGVGNIYSFTKIVFWIGMILGAVANTWSANPSELQFYQSIRWRIRQNSWCFFAVLILAMILVPFMAPNNDVLEIWLLTLYLYVGMVTVLSIHSFCQLRSWSPLKRMTMSLLTAIGWGFIRVSLDHP